MSFGQKSKHKCYVGVLTINYQGDVSELVQLPLLIQFVHHDFVMCWVLMTVLQFHLGCHGFSFCTLLKVQWGEGRGQIKLHNGISMQK